MSRTFSGKSLCKAVLATNVWFLVLLFLCAGLSACATNANAGVPTTSFVPPAGLDSTPSPVLGIRPTGETRAVIPSQTPVSQATPATTATSKPAATLTPFPTTPPTPIVLACLAQGGRTVRDSLPTKLLRYPLEYRVHLPPCYDRDIKRRYPVLYLHHGQGFTDEQWERIGAGETADRLFAAGELSPFIIVMPYEHYGGEPPDTKFSQAVTDLLLPHIDQVYRTIPDRAHRAVGGLSRGAGWAVHFGLGHWELFSAVGAHSPAVFYSDAEQLRTWLNIIPPDEMPRIFIDIGDRDRPEIMRVTLWFESVLNEKDIAHDWYLFTGYHSEEYWSAHIEQYLRWYAELW